MADRSFHRRESQGIRHVEMGFSVVYAAGAPKFLEGDTAGALVGSYFTIAQSGAGVLTVTTTNPYPGFVMAKATLQMVTPNVNSLAPICSKPVQAANGTWSFTVNTGVNAAGAHTATTPANGDGLFVEVVLRNSTSLP